MKKIKFLLISIWYHLCRFMFPVSRSRYIITPTLTKILRQRYAIYNLCLFVLDHVYEITLSVVDTDIVFKFPIELLLHATSEFHLLTIIEGSLASVRCVSFRNFRPKDMKNKIIWDNLPFLMQFLDLGNGTYLFIGLNKASSSTLFRSSSFKRAL